MPLTKAGPGQLLQSACLQRRRSNAVHGAADEAHVIPGDRRRIPNGANACVTWFAPFSRSIWTACEAESTSTSEFRLGRLSFRKSHFRNPIVRSSAQVLSTQQSSTSSMALRLRMSPQKERREQFQPDGAASSQRGDSKQARFKSMQFSLCQVVVLTALSALISAMLTAMVSAHSFSLTMTGQFLDQHPMFVSRQLRPSTPAATSVATSETTEDPTAPITDLETQTQWEDNPTPKIVWLMSFPNRCVRVS
jgi:hypothetical protein